MTREWMARALCQGWDPEAFFPGKGDATSKGTKAALALCARCPVRAECLDLALSRDHDGLVYAPDGIWGGTHALQRRGMVAYLRGKDVTARG